MRRLAPLLLLLPLACTSSPSAQPEGASLPNGLGLEAGAAVETARAFLEAYADPSAVASTHARLVAGSDLRDWVHWVMVQNSGIRFVGGGDVDIRGLRVVRFDPPLATLGVEALIRTQFRTEDGVGGRERRFGGLLLQRLESGWRVVDALQDARQMTRTITVLDPPVEVREDAVDVEIESVFRFTGGTVVNMQVANRGSASIDVNLERSLLFVNDQEHGGAQMTGSLFRPIDPGREVEGALTFEPIEETDVPQAILLRVRGSRPIDVLAQLPAEAFFLEGAGQSASNSGGDGSSAA